MCLSVSAVFFFLLKKQVRELVLTAYLCWCVSFCLWWYFSVSSANSIQHLHAPVRRHLNPVWRILEFQANLKRKTSICCEFTLSVFLFESVLIRKSWAKGRSATLTPIAFSYGSLTSPVQAQMSCPCWRITVIIKFIFASTQLHSLCADIHHRRHWSVLFPSKGLDC